MATLTEGRYPGECIVSEAKGHRSRDKVTILSGEVLKSCQVVSKVTASGKYRSINTAGSDGSQTAAGILYAAVDATGADAVGVVFTRDCEVNEKKVDWGSLDSSGIAAAKVQLAAAGIIVRTTI